eukprot:2650548-Prymnesium_polylepis.1
MTPQGADRFCFTHRVGRSARRARACSRCSRHGAAVVTPSSLRDAARQLQCSSNAPADHQRPHPDAVLSDLAWAGRDPDAAFSPPLLPPPPQFVARDDLGGEHIRSFVSM